jgi:hypothetical protein
MKKILVILAFVAVSANAQKGKWVNLFDGKTTTGWHLYNKTGEVTGWHVMGGALMTHGKSGDLVSDKEYENFILEFEFNVMPKGNSGIIYKVIEKAEYSAPYISGPEYQVIDDANYPSEITDFQKTGGNYDVHKPLTLKAVKPAGQWNKGKLVINNNKIEHYLNGVLVAKYVYGSDEWKTLVGKSKFATWAYATPHAKGKLALQDHGDAVSYRKIRIKEL